MTACASRLPIQNSRHISLRTFNGETALLILQGPFSRLDCARLVVLIKDLQDSDYVQVFLDVSGAEYGEGATDMLKTLENTGVRLIVSN